jgi:hypothetical protein
MGEFHMFYVLLLVLPMLVEMFFFVLLHEWSIRIGHAPFEAWFL